MTTKDIKEPTKTRDANGTKATDRRWAKPLLTVGLCLCLAAVLIPITRNALSDTGYDDLRSDEEGLLCFSSYDELNRTIERIREDRQSNQLLLKNETVEDLAMSEDAEIGTATTGTAADQTPDHSSTYTQEEDVDEADIVKTDGKYIYHVSYQENQVIITGVDGEKTKELSSIGEKGDSLIEDLYVRGDRLIVISDTRIASSKLLQSDSEIDSAAVTVYDISDRRHPEPLGRYTQTGTVLSSRMIDDRVVLVTGQFGYSDGKVSSLPGTSYDGGRAKPVAIEDIRCVPSPSSTYYTNIGMIDTSAGKLSEKTTSTRSVLGGSDQIYCSSDELYMTSTVYEEPKRRILPFRKYESEGLFIDGKTQIIKADISEKTLKISGLAMVDGIVNDQFSMDATDGRFRIATTSRRGDEDVNNLFVLDGKLEEVGSLRNFARNEHIEAVRYIGDLAYVITYEQTDPLFIIDLSDPADPVIRGHVKISGFSTLLVPVDKDHILGFGFSTETTEGGEATDGLKLALFDVSDPDDPKVADSSEFKDVSSEIQYNHKALLVGPKGSYYAVPYDRYYADWIDDGELIEDAGEPSDKGNADRASENDNGIMVFDARGGKIRLIRDLPSDSSIKRCIYIGDLIYGITTDDTIHAYRL